MIEVRAKFQPGRIVATPGLMKAIPDGDYAMAALVQFLKGKWGIVDSEDWDANDYALEHGGRLLGVYPFPDSAETFWIICEADRSVTTFLLPSEY